MAFKSLQPSRRRTARRERIGELATLPVFYKLRGSKVLVAGGTEAAAWKAELLSAAGAEVHIHAEALEPAFTELLAASGVSGSCTWHQRRWSEQSFRGMRIAVCDAASEAEAEAFYCAGRAAGAAVNVIDRPDWCEFQFGSIVNRSPVVIGISTDGAAPILGQAIRRRIETLIAPSVAAWARLAQSIRGLVNERLEPGAPRRVFWEAFVDRAFGSEPNVNAVDDMVKKASVISASGIALTGRVTMIEAKNRDAELLTLKAVRALQAADVILFDEAVSSEILELARREAQRLPSGKVGEFGEAQALFETMAALARSGKHVVRVTSCISSIDSDVACLRAEGLMVKVLPGVAEISVLPRDPARSEHPVPSRTAALA